RGALLGLIACGKDSPPNDPAPKPDPSAQEPGADPDGGAPPAPAQAGDPGSEGPPLITGFNPLLRPPVSVGCTPGDTQPCELDQLCKGVARCAADGTAFGACQCDASPTFGSG